MAEKARISNGEKKNTTNLKVVVKMLQKKLSKLKSASYKKGGVVKEGHFAVIAVDENDEFMKRFVLPLSYLTHPSFLRLLEKAAEEYGFDREGTLMVPCRTRVLERMLAGHS